MKGSHDTSSDTNQGTLSPGGTRGNGDALAVQALDQGRVVGRIGVERPSVGEGAVDVGPLDQHVTDAALVDLVEQLRERNVLGRRALAGILEQREQSEQEQDNDDPEREITEIGVHPVSSAPVRSSGDT
jgi:hypothetical protein